MRGVVMLVSTKGAEKTGVCSGVCSASTAERRQSGPDRVMASFGGHALPGTFFLFFGFWLVVKHTLRHSCRTARTKGRHSDAPFLQRMEYIEGGIQAFASFVGILVEQFYPGGPIAHLYDAENHSWVKLMNWQHCTMYLFFGISGVSLIVTKRFQLTALRVNCLTLSLALFMEGFLFYFHLHGRPPLDAHIHTVLLVPVFAGSVSTMLEVFIKDNIILELFSAGMFILQGTWFYEIGFVIFPLNGVEWDQNQHTNLMFVTMCFGWHLAAALLLVAGNSAAVWLILKKFSGRSPNIEIGMRTTSPTGCHKALLEGSDEE
ncbi:transmembrane protein 45B [Cynoglossus semilaevis]|uniref:Transmembrane protein 45B n=1 Tax=Cynoglossus semilaevis TaxID=244447 RepID=A0A3P8VIH4_CYNSE|nr:transmembrane protein 45B [Cynoglossus semilaevis]